MLFFKKLRPIALLSDFGSADHYIGTVKAVISTLSPHTHIFDITHEISPGNILSGAFILGAVFDWLPGNAVVWAVADPGVGSQRKILCAQIGNRYVIAPDNGLLSMLVRLYGEFPVRECDAERIATFASRTPSATFHGRDIFAPAAVLLSLGRFSSVVGPHPGPCTPILLPEIFAATDENAAVSGRVLHCDRFGNAITSIMADQLPAGKFLLRIDECAFRCDRFATTFSDVLQNEPMLFIGSAGFLEIAVRDGNAADRYGIVQNMRVLVSGRDEH
ncbi:MAG: SAM-dependent chlorinase/fluorinase [Spirochaetales bacterium]|nr:SAM-dependent chlorinase/fluorinase [Spirochaetales bacterium]